jgi:hypothetical protein
MKHTLTLIATLLLATIASLSAVEPAKPNIVLIKGNAQAMMIGSWTLHLP